MRKLLLIFFLITQTLVCFSQCLSGNCKDGFGKYDFGFAIYEGNFVAEKPSGKGTMDYGAGEKFVGNFKNGQEDGDGVLYKKNVPTNVTYSNGKAKIREVQVVIGGNAPTVPGCIQGDCYNGFGIVKFDSGNRYEGNFVNGIKSGEGKFYFAQGNVFSGNFKDNIYTNGVFKYAQEQITFEGNYNSDGTPKSGDYYYETNKATVTIVDGKITKVVNPVAEKARKLAEEQSKPRSCSACGGAGMNAGVTRAVQKESYYSINYVNSSGNTVGTSSGNVARSTVYETSWPTECNACHGTGQERPRGIIINTGRY
jgi:hypothetical protein